VNGICELAPDPAAVGKSCHDGNACTTGDVCKSDGSCVGTPIVCAAVDQCHDADMCNPSTGHQLRRTARPASTAHSVHRVTHARIGPACRVRPWFVRR
jgi:hypothetical protein